MRAQIEPTFKAALDEENAKYGVKTGDKNAVKMELVWFGDRPAHQRANFNDIATQIYWQTAQTVGIDKIKELKTNSSSLNDNVPAAVGVPTVNFNVHTPAANGGGILSMNGVSQAMLRTKVSVFPHDSHGLNCCRLSYKYW